MNLEIPEFEILRCCTKCKFVKPISSFAVSSKGKSGRSAQCKSCVSIRTRSRYQIIKTREISRQKKYRETINGKEMTRRSNIRRRVYFNERHKKARLQAIKILGSQCNYCGFSDIRALQIDHVFGGGTKERNRYGYEHILQNVRSGKYQVLCANCNWIKRYENREMFRKRDNKCSMRLRDLPLKAHQD